MEVINSFFSNIKDKLTNPFFGTLILVLLIDHWELWYAIFNFGENYTLNQKVEYIEDYIVNNLTVYSFIWDIVQAFLYMLLGYLIVVGTRSLVIWIEYNLMPTITGKVVNKNVVKKSEYDQVVKEREEYFDQYEEQRENVRKFSKTIDEQTAQIKLKDKDLLEQSDTISKTVRSFDITKKKLDQVEKDRDEKTTLLKQVEHENSVKKIKLGIYHDLFFSDENKNFYDSIEKFSPEILRKYRELKHDNKWMAFLAVGNFFEFGGSISGDLLDEMRDRNLVFEKGSHEGLTPIGNILWTFRKVFDPENSYKIY